MAIDGAVSNQIPPIPYLRSLLAGHRIRCGTERAMQDDVEQVLDGAGVAYSREHRLTPGPIDFLVGRIGLECKIEGSLFEVLRQCQGYLSCAEVDGLLLVTKRAVHTQAPETLAGKPFGVLWVAGDAL